MMMLTFVLGAAAAAGAGRLLRRAHVHAAGPAPLRRPQILLFGDSITQKGFSPDGGWAARLADDYQRKADVVNRGYSGYNTRWARHALPSILSAHAANPPALVTLFFGANDAALPEAACAFQAVPLPEFSAHLRSMVAAVRAASPRARVLLITPPPVDEAGRAAYQRGRLGPAWDGVVERTHAASGNYAAAVKALGVELGLPVVDLWASIQLQPEWRGCLGDDGLHLSPRGQAAVHAAVVDALARAHPELSPERLPWDWPPHLELGADPAATLAAWAMPQPLP